MSLLPLPRLDRPWLMALVAGLLTLLVTASSLDPAGDFPGWREGPGVTIDESFNIQQGVRLVVASKAWLLGALTWRDIFGEAEDLGPNAPAGYHLPDHPPLGRFWLGLAHEITLSFVRPLDHEGPFVTTAARVGSAAAFAATVFLVAWAAGCWYGQTAGVIAAVSLVAMPRVFGHAHLAALETCMGLASAAAVLSVAHFWTGSEPPRARVAILTGLLFGAALLTKVQAVFLPVAIGIWAFHGWRLKAWKSAFLWMATGLATLFLFWPWLWLDPIGHFAQYLGRTTQRAELHVWYMGRVFDDRSTPWHYPWVMALATTPLVVLLLGIAGLFRGHSANADSVGASPNSKTEPLGSVGRREGLLIVAILAPLIVFSVPGVAAYDGVRLFLVIFPLVAVLAGRGAAVLLSRVRNSTATSNSTRKLGLACGAVAMSALFLATAIHTWRLSPCWLSGYGLLAGSLRNAEKLGFETTYWGDSVTRTFLEEVVRSTPEGALVDVAPVLHQFQLPEMMAQSPLLRRHGVRLRPLDVEAPGEYVLVFLRRADLPEHWATHALRSEPLAAVRREGVLLAALYHVPRNDADD